MEISYPAGRDVIEAVLPHRDPFVWVSRVLECEPGVSVKAELDVSPDLPLFEGHFPDYPVLPGVCASPRSRPLSATRYARPQPRNTC